MKLSAGPLLHCLLRAMSQPTAHGSCARFQKNTLESSQHVQMITINLDADDVLLIDLLSDLLFVSILLMKFCIHQVTFHPGKQVSLGTAFIRILAWFFPAGKGSFHWWCVAAPGWAGQAISQQLGCHAGPDGPSGSHNMQKAMKIRVPMFVRLWGYILCL